MSGTQSSDLDMFRDAVRAWLTENCPASLRAGAADARAPREDTKLWLERLLAKGWTAPTWPKQYGGGGLSVQHGRVIAQEMSRLGVANPIAGGMGYRMFGPTLLEFGNDPQKQRHIPPIIRGETRWCQGFSEPGAGSDLASLQLKCEDKGDHYLVNGSKIWTSGANHADWCFCLVRTDTTKKHEGISFLLIEMKTPGVNPVPIATIAGASPFCQTFFTDVKIPKDNLMGELNKGWTYAKRLLQFERQGPQNRTENAVEKPKEKALDPLIEAALTMVSKDSARLADSDLRTRMSEHLMEARAFRLTSQRVAAEARNSNSPNTTTSILKNVSAKTRKAQAELMIEVLGNRGFGWEGEGFSKDQLQVVRGWLSGKATSIFAGSDEVQNNIISKRILGLPDPTGSA